MRKWSVYDFIENVEAEYLYTGLLSYEETSVNEGGEDVMMSRALFSVELDHGQWWIQAFWFMNFIFGDRNDDDNMTGVT